MQNYMCLNVSYSVIKMSGDSEITTLTRYIPLDVFISLIKSDIQKLIREYGHRNCGLIQEELCDKIKKIIPEKKKIIFKHMDEPSMQKWNSEWSSKRNDFFNKLYEEEGFINKCFPKKYQKKNQSLNQLLSKHIEFCKENDQRLSVIGKSREYSVCLEYNVWIINKTASFTSEYLQNVNKFTFPTVKKYFNTKDHPEGYNPLTTYRNIRLNCEIYNPKSKSYQPIPVENTLPNSLPPTATDLDQKSRGKGGSSIPSGDGGTEKNKYDVNIHPKTEPHASNSRESSTSKTKVDDTPNGQHDDLKAKGTVSPINAQVAKGQPNEATDTKAQSPEQLSETTSSISPKNSLVAKVQDPSPPVIEGQGTDSDATPSTTSATSGTKHSTENIPSPLAPDLSFSQPQPPSVAAVADQYPQEPTPPDLIIKSTNHGASLTSSDPGLVPSHVADSDSSEISSTSTTIYATSSTTTISTPGSSLAQDPHIPTPSTQPVVTTSIITTITQGTTSASSSPAITVSVMGTNPISSTVGITSTMDSGKSNAPFKNIPGSRDPNILPPKNKDDSLSHNKGKTSKTNTIYKYYLHA
ncbi:hypothetical protein POVWA1_078130 [Plasmodium ovale wallikeri]|uniref:STP1 protein n=1 Tax=Plasmodium ovale wallikeri TaxID=864142 RepID=A0A1A9AKL5_PLAOA|nr:hypothetical protein POVWA1_078130 [Plasmodium ovale wallikeri]